MKRNCLLDSVGIGRVCNEEPSPTLSTSIEAHEGYQSVGTNDPVSTPIPLFKKRRHQGPSPTKVFDDAKNDMIGLMGLNGLFDLLKKTESNAVRPLDFSKQKYITSNMRAILVDWMTELCYNYSLHRSTFHHAVNLLDRYISINNEIKKNEFQTIGAVCVIIATKYNEPVSISLDMIIKSTGDSCTKSQLIQIEKDIIQSLEWYLMASTMAHWVLFFLYRLEEHTNALPFDLYYRCMDLCDRLLLDVTYSRFSARDLSLAVVSAFSCENTQLQTSLKQLLEEFALCQECVRWVLDIGLSAPSHPLLQFLESTEGEQVKYTILTKKELHMEFNFIQPHNQFSLSHYSAAAQ